MQILLQPKQALLDYLIEKGVATWQGYGGSRGGGKSGAVRRIMLRRRKEHPRTTCLILRRVWDDVNKNHVNKMWEEFPSLHDYYNAQDKVIKLPESLGEGMIFFDGAETEGDVMRKAYGPEYFDVCVDQAEQFSEKELTQLKTVVRWPGTPEGSCKYLLPFNPGGQGAAFLQRIFSLKEFHESEKPEDYAFVQAYGWDNVEWSRAALAADGYSGDCMGTHCGKCGPCVYYSWTDEARFKYYTTRSQYGQEQNALPAHMRAGQLMGDFQKFAGQYFSNFDPGIHVWDLSDVNIKPWWPVWASIDWGYQHSTSVHWHCQAGYQTDGGELKRLVITFRELIKDHLSERALAEEFCAANNGLKLVNIWAGHDLWAKNQTGETKEQAMSKVFRAHGLPSLKQANINRIDGWRFLHRGLDENEWIITRNCTQAIRAIPSAIFDDKKQNEDILKTNTTYDDVLDELRYGLYSQYAAKEEPWEERIKNRFSGVKDLTNRNILIMKANADRNAQLHNKGWANNHSSGRSRRYGS